MLTFLNIATLRTTGSNELMLLHADRITGFGGELRGFARVAGMVTNGVTHFLSAQKGICGDHDRVTADDIGSLLPPDAFLPEGANAPLAHRDWDEITGLDDALNSRNRAVVAGDKGKLPTTIATSMASGGASREIGDALSIGTSNIIGYAFNNDEYGLANATNGCQSPQRGYRRRTT